MTHALVTCPTLLLCLLAGSSAVAAADPDDISGGERNFAQHCVTCHAQPRGRMPDVAALRARAPEQLVQAMRSGAMRQQASGLSVYQMQGIAYFLTGRMPTEPAVSVAEPNRCARRAHGATAGTSPAADPRVDDWNGWGRDDSNARFAPNPGFTAAEVSRLKVKWAFGYRGSYVYGQPVVVAGRVYVTSSGGRVHALDLASGCVHWSFDADTGARTAIVAGRAGEIGALFFGDDSGTVYALRADDGQLLWKRRLDPHPYARITGSPKLHDNVLYVPVSSLEEVVAADSKYPCCTFVGSLAALDARSGALRWQSKTLDPPAALRLSDVGTQLHGPAGAAIWSSPTVDAERGLVYVATGNSYTDVPSTHSDAVLALWMDTGTLLWSRQLTPGDNFNMSCARPQVCGTGAVCDLGGKTNCPQLPGPDLDFGASTVLRDLPDGRRVLIASQKSGVVYALDTAQQGAVLWQLRLGAGGPLGGIEWGAAADAERVYAPISDAFAKPSEARPGLSAVDLASGTLRWSVPAPVGKCRPGITPCLNAFVQAASAMPGLVFAGSLDGHLRAFDASSGAQRWDFDTARRFRTVNRVRASGGSLDLGGAVLAGGMLLVNSGYGRLVGQPGNVLLALSVGGR
jgi:polyvinyl alcohol dehydrogenase (cytochrome)